MKDLLRMLLLVGLAVSATWAASWVTGRGPPSVAMLQQDSAGQSVEPPGPANGDPPDNEPANTEPANTEPANTEKVAIPDVTPAEIDAAIKEVEKTLSGTGRDAGEAVAEKPLPADLAIPLPSDI